LKGGYIQGSHLGPKDYIMKYRGQFGQLFWL
jgi:hypothetical protein